MNHDRILLVLERLDSLVKVRAFGRNAPDKLVEKMCSMHALLAGSIELSVTALAFVFAFALREFQTCLSPDRR